MRPCQIEMAQRFDVVGAGILRLAPGRMQGQPDSESALRKSVRRELLDI